MIPAATRLVGCTAPTEEQTVIVQRPPDGDSSCIGVDGFVVTVQEHGEAPRVYDDLRRAPVLSNQDCRLTQAFSHSDVDVNRPLQITVEGYDAFRQLQVHGTTMMARLSEAPMAPLQLAQAWDVPRRIVVLGLAEIDGGAREAITDFVLEKLVVGNELGKGQKITPVGVFSRAVGDGERPFFHAEPIAFGIPADLLAVTDPIRVTLSRRDGAVLAGDYSLQASGSYLQATFTGRPP